MKKRTLELLVILKADKVLRPYGNCKLRVAQYQVLSMKIYTQAIFEEALSSLFQ